MIEIQGLSFRYPGGGFELDIPDFRVASGEKLAVIDAFLSSHFPAPLLSERVPRVVQKERGLVDPPNIRTCSRTCFLIGCKNSSRSS